MYIDTLPEEACAYTRGIWQDPFTSYWQAVVEVDGEAYDLGRFGSFAEAGAAYLKTKQALEAV